jgi:hypothetical protein
MYPFLKRRVLYYCKDSSQEARKSNLKRGIERIDQVRHRDRASKKVVALGIPDSLFRAEQTIR